MVSYQYTYLIGVLVCLLIWFILFFWRKDIRKEMLIMSFTVGLVATISNHIYTIDWWHPLSIAKIRWGGPEDFLFSFSVTGIASVIYEEMFKKRLKIKKVPKRKEFNRNLNLLYLVLLLIILFFGGFYVLKLHSFWATVIAFIIPTLIIWFKRRDLVISSLASGFLLMVVSFFGFLIPETISPGWVQSAWYLENLTGVIIWKAPLEDLIWFFLFGLFLGPLYEYWKEGKLINVKS